MRRLNDNVHYAPNVADTRLFATRSSPVEDPAVAALSAPRIVFTGAIVANKLDLGLISELAAARPGWSFAFVGPVGPGTLAPTSAALRTVHNVHLLGHRPYERLPEVLRAADAAIMPYLTDGDMRSVFPMKTSSTWPPACRWWRRDCRRSPRRGDRDGHDRRRDRRCARGADGGRHARAPARRSAAAEPHSWESRIGEIEAALLADDRRLGQNGLERLYRYWRSAISRPRPRSRVRRW